MAVLCAAGSIVFFSSCAIAQDTAKSETPVSFEEAFGAASAGLLYNVQVVIGIAADAYSKDVYTAEEMDSIIGEQKTIIETLIDYTGKLMNLPKVSGNDKKSLADMNDCMGKLTNTADALLAYVADPSDDNANRFQDKRKASYDSLAELLGLNKQQ